MPLTVYRCYPNICSVDYSTNGKLITLYPTKQCQEVCELESRHAHIEPGKSSLLYLHFEMTGKRLLKSCFHTGSFCVGVPWMHVNIHL